MTEENGKLCDNGYVRQPDSSCVPCSSICSSWKDWNNEEMKICQSLCKSILTTPETIIKSTPENNSSLLFLLILIPIVIVVIVLISFRKKIFTRCKSDPDLVLQIGDPENDQPILHDSIAENYQPILHDSIVSSNKSSLSSSVRTGQPKLILEYVKTDDTPCPSLEGILDFPDEKVPLLPDFNYTQYLTADTTKQKSDDFNSESTQFHSLKPSKISANLNIKDSEMKNIQFRKDTDNDDNDDNDGQEFSDNYNSIKPQGTSDELQNINDQKENISLISMSSISSTRPKVNIRDIKSKCSEPKILPSILENIELEKESIPAPSIISDTGQSDESIAEVSHPEPGATDLNEELSFSLDSFNEGEEMFYSLAPY